MSNKHYRTPANTQPKIAQRAMEAIMNGQPRSDEPPPDDQIIKRLKRYLSQVVAVAEDSLAGADDLVDTRHGLQAARTLLSVLKHEQRLKERAEKAAQDAAKEARRVSAESAMQETTAAETPSDAERAIAEGLAKIEDSMAQLREARQLSELLHAQAAPPPQFAPVR